VRGVINFAKDSFIGFFNLTLGASGGAPLPTLTEEEAEFVRNAPRTGQPIVTPSGRVVGRQVETEREIEQQRLGGALALSFAAGPVLATSLRAIPQAIVRKTLEGVGVGTVFGAIRPRGEEESLVKAIITDAVLFGGIHLAGSMLLKGTKPINLSGDVVAERITAAERAASPAEYGAAIFEEAQTIGVYQLLERLPQLRL